MREREAQRRGRNALPAVSGHYFIFYLFLKEIESGGFHSDSLDVEPSIQACTAHYFRTFLFPVYISVAVHCCRRKEGRAFLNVQFAGRPATLSAGLRAAFLKLNRER